MESRNAKTQRVTTSTILKSGAFMRGWTDYMKGKPFAVDKERWRDHWNYERGRGFACFVVSKLGEGSRDKKFKNGNRVPASAVELFRQAIQKGYVL